MGKYKRIFTIVIDSLGVGALPDAADYGDAGTDTLLSDDLLLVRKSRTARIMIEITNRCFFVRLIFIRIFPFHYIENMYWFNYNDS